MTLLCELLTLGSPMGNESEFVCWLVIHASLIVIAVSGILAHSAYELER